MERFCKTVLISFISCLLLYCASANKQRRIVLESSQSKKPQWTEKKMWEDKEYIFFVEKCSGCNDPVEGLRKAKQKLIDTLNTEMKERIITEFDEISDEIDYGDWIDKVKEDFVNETMLMLDFNNLIPDDTYYEKIKIVEQDKSYYNCYVYKALSRSGMNNRKIGAIDKLMERYREKEIKEFLSSLKEKYYK